MRKILAIMAVSSGWVLANDPFALPEGSAGIDPGEGVSSIPSPTPLPPPAPKEKQHNQSSNAGDPPKTEKVPIGPDINQELVTKLQKLMEENAALRKSPPASSATEETRKTDEGNAEILEFLRGKFANTNIDVYVREPYVVVTMPELVYKLGGVKAPLSVKEKLRPISEAVIRFGSRYDLLVEGHTDASPVKRQSAYGDNWTVGYERAKGVAKTLEGLQVPESNMGLLTRGSGLPNGGASRRVELVFAPKREAGTPTAFATPAISVPTTPSKDIPKPKKRTNNSPGATKHIADKDVPIAIPHKTNPTAKSSETAGGLPQLPAVPKSSETAGSLPQLPAVPKSSETAGSLPQLPAVPKSSETAGGLPQLPAVPRSSETAGGLPEIPSVPKSSETSGRETVGLPSIPAVHKKVALTFAPQTETENDIIELPVLPMPGSQTPISKTPDVKK